MVAVTMRPAAAPAVSAPRRARESGITFREDPERDAASIVTEDEILRIQGGREALNLLAANIETFASEANASDHCHVDSPTYDFIAPESDPLVIAFMR